MKTTPESQPGVKPLVALVDHVASQLRITRAQVETLRDFVTALPQEQCDEFREAMQDAIDWIDLAAEHELTDAVRILEGKPHPNEMAKTQIPQNAD